ncbi:hypothetical protein D3C71_1705610 [compost metagenome]
MVPASASRSLLRPGNPVMPVLLSVPSTAKKTILVGQWCRAAGQQPRRLVCSIRSAELLNRRAPIGMFEKA